MKFRCKQTGNVFEFSWWDIEGMKKHPDYEMVEEEVKTEIEPPKRGRPPKKTEEINE